MTITFEVNPIETAPKDGTAILIQTATCGQWFQCIWHEDFEGWLVALPRQVIDHTGACSYMLEDSETLLGWTPLPEEASQVKPVEGGLAESISVRLRRYFGIVANREVMEVVDDIAALESQLAATTAKLREAELVRDQAIEIARMDFIKDAGGDPSMDHLWTCGGTHDPDDYPELANHLATPAPQEGGSK